MRQEQVLLGLALALAGCLEAPPPRRMDASLDAAADAPPPGPPRIVSLDVVDRRGASWPLEGVPTAPVLRLTFAEPIVETEDEPPPIWLFANADLEDLRDDLGADPLRVATRERIVAAALDGSETTWSLTPDARLPRGGELAIGIGAWLRASTSGMRLGEPWIAQLRVSDAGSAGAAVTDSWPPDGASAVPLALREIVVRFDGPVEGVRAGIALLEEDGTSVPALVRPSACDPYGWIGGACAVLAPERALAPDVTHQIVVAESVVDATGAPVGPWTARFTTARSSDDEPPALLALPCGLDEQTVDAGCLLADDSRLVLRIQASEPVRVSLSIAGRTLLAVAPRGSATLAVLDLPPDTELAAILRLEDLGGLVLERALRLATAPPLPTVSIAEVRADPLGAEPRQEYVEVVNYGAMSVDLEGLSIADRPDSEGDVVSRSQPLAPGQRALLVADGFDPDDPSDDRVPPGVPLVRVGASLASGGITNAGEALFLRDSSMHRLSASPARSTGAGLCLVRTGSDPRGDASFEPMPCSPGLP